MFLQILCLIGTEKNGGGKNCLFTSHRLLNNSTQSTKMEHVDTTKTLCGYFAAGWQNSFAHGGSVWPHGNCWFAHFIRSFHQHQGHGMETKGLAKWTRPFSGLSNWQVLTWAISKEQNLFVYHFKLLIIHTGDFMSQLGGDHEMHAYSLYWVRRVNF